MNTQRRKRLTVQWMTATAMMIALTLVLANTPLGLIRMPFLTATTLHIPVIIATLALGWESGVLTGLTFGISSWISNLSGVSFFAPFFINPLVSVLPRLLFPLCVYGAAKVLACLTARFDRRRVIAYVGASVLGTALHTAMVMGMIYALNHEKIAMTIGNSANIPQVIVQKGVGKGIFALALTNGVPECIVAAVIAPVVALALDRALRGAKTR